MFGKTVVRRISVRKRGTERDEWRKYHNKELHNWWSNKGGWRVSCSTHGTAEKFR